MTGLVLVSGLPAAGKSTLSRRLGADLRWPVLSRDRIRRTAFTEVTEALADGEHWRMGRAIDLIINEVAGELLDAGAGAVIDSNFNWIQQADAIRMLIEARSVSCLEVCLWADPGVCRQRFIDRSEPPLTAELDPIFTKAVARDRTPVLAPPAPIIEVDTTDFAVLEDRYPEIIARARAHFGTSPVARRASSRGPGPRQVPQVPAG